MLLSCLKVLFSIIFVPKFGVCAVPRTAVDGLQQVIGCARGQAQLSTCELSVLTCSDQQDLVTSCIVAKPFATVSSAPAAAPGYCSEGL